MIVPGSASPLLTTTDGGYTIAKSLRFRSSATAYLSRTPASAGNRQKWTWSGWVKRGALSSLYCLFGGSSATANSYNTFRFQSDGTFDMQQYVAGVGTDFAIRTNAIYRDPSAWYHIVVAYDSTQATDTNRVKLYINGSQVTSFQTTTYPAQNTNSYFNNNTAQYLGVTTYNSATDQPFDGYMTEINFIDGAQKAATDFGETDSVTGVWKPKAYSGTYGTNGFYLKFTDVATTSGSNAGLGKDFSGNGNYWTTNNISVTSGSTYDSMKDVPTLTDTDTANYCVLNPVSNIGNGTISAGNLNYVASSAAWMSCAGTIFPSSGKWYFEVTLDQFNSSFMLGVCSSSFTSWATYAGASTYAWALQGTSSGTGKWNNNSSATLAAGEVAATNDKYMVAYDIDAGKLWFGKNGTWYSSGDPAAGTNAVYTSVTGSLSPVLSSNTTTDKLAINLGQRPFSYTPPTGYKALNTYNLPDPTIVAGNKYMDATTWTANGTSQSITNSGFKPDLVWFKPRSGVANHQLVDSNRGASKLLYSNLTNAEDTNANFLTSFDTSGFSVGSANYGNGTSLVGWQWQAGQGTTSSNTSGTITSTTSVSASAGFSVVTFSGNSTQITVGHGLGVAPKMIIVKDRTNAGSNWCVYHASTGAGGFLLLNATDAFTSNTTMWNNTTPTSTVFNWAYGTSSTNYVAYCWAEIAGFSKFGSYTGNGSADGVFVYTGFRPKWIMIKNTTTAGTYWFINDSSRNTYNPTGLNLGANASDAEGNDAPVFDFLSNGFKLRCTYGSFNTNGNTMIYAAFAENPFKNALAR